MSDTANERMSAEGFRQHQSESMSEEAIQKAVVDFADRLVVDRPELKMLFHVPNGGKMPRGSAGKLKGMGMRKGVPDLWLPVPTPPYDGLVLELKSADGYLRPEQVWWLQHLQNYGYAVAVARSVGDAIARLTDYLDGGHDPMGLPYDRAEPPPHAS